MSRTELRRLAGFTVLLVLLVGCGSTTQPVAVSPGGTPSDEGTPTGPAAGEGELVLQVDHTGGFVPPEMLATRLPLVTVYDDGRVITRGPQIEIWPSPALPNLLVQQVDPAAVDRLVQLALDAGVGDAPDVGMPPVADAPNTRFMVRADDGTQVLEVPALMESMLGEEPLPGLTEEQVAVREELRGLLDALTDLHGTLGADAVESEQQPYEPEAVAAVARAWTPPELPDAAEPQEIPWPAPALPGEELGAGRDLGLGCVVARGEEAGAVLEAAQQATVVTPWVSNDERWSVTLRPLLPHEEGCADLLEQS